MDALINERKSRFALRLFDIGAVKFGRFRLKLHEKHPGAPESPFYLNLRVPNNPKPGPLENEDVLEAADLMFRIAVRVDELEFTHIAGIPNAGDPFAQAFQAIACEADLPAPYKLLRLGKEHLPNGMRRIAHLEEGKCEEGDQVLMVDDLITHGESKLEAMQTLKELGLRISGLVVLVDREQGGAKKITDAKYHFVAVYTLTELMHIYLSAGKISEEQLWSCLGYQDELDAYYVSKGQTD